jgi:GntR family transcriptional regulator
MNGAPRIRIDPNSPVPAYRQIVDAIRVLLVGGQLHPGDVLPPVRRLAVDLGVHFNTVGEAYRQLAEEGWLEVRHGRNATVMSRAQPAASDEGLESFRRRLQSLVAEARAAGVTAARIVRELTALKEEIGR